MKKLLLVLILSFSMVFIVGASASAVVVVKGGIDMPGTVSIEAVGISVDYDTKMGISIGGEFLTEISDGLYLGGGIEYQMERKVDVTSGVGFNYIPIYGLAQYYINDSIYLLGKAGYNFFSREDKKDWDDLGVDLKGGLYFGFGAGYWLQENMILEASYSFHNGVMKDEVDKLEFDYSKLGISVGFVF